MKTVDHRLSVRSTDDDISLMVVATTTCCVDWTEAGLHAQREAIANNFSTILEISACIVNVMLQHGIDAFDQHIFQKLSGFCEDS